MNKLKISIFFIFIFLSVQSFAQKTVVVERSTKTEMVNGNKFYIHTVVKGQTAYSISKAYNVSVKDIYKNNPGSELGLKLDQELKIPVVVKAIGQADPIQDSLSEDGKFIYHRVERGETLYGIMKHFNVNQDVLLENNPGLTVNLHPGDIIKIPTQEQLVSKKAQELYAEIIEYKVKKRDTYYRLEKKFAVTQPQLEQLNPELKTLGLQKGMLILVPSGLKKMDTIPVYVEILPDSLDAAADTLLQDTLIAQILNCDSTYAQGDTFRIALMIPFYSELESEIRTSSSYYTKNAQTYKSFQFIQFYEGFLMALDSISQMGFNAEVFVYDTKADTATVRQIVNKEEFSSIDLVIGPLYNDNVKIVLKAGKANNIKVVSPFSREMDLVADNPHLYKIAPSIASIIESSCDWVADSLPNSRIIILHEEGKDEKEIISLMNRSFQRHAASGIDTNEIFIYSTKNNGLNKMIAKLTKDRKNILINLVNNEAKVSNFLRDLDRKSEDYEIYLIGSELNWRRFETLEIKYLVDLHLTQCSSHFINPLDTTVVGFEQSFIKRYKTVPNKLAFNGFDISWFFMNALFHYGVNFDNCTNHLKVHTMSTEFRFKKNGQGAYENSYLNIYQYDNYQLLSKKSR